MSLARKFQIMWLKHKLRALVRDIVWAKRDARRHINDLRGEAIKTERRLFTLALEERQSGGR